MKFFRRKPKAPVDEPVDPSFRDRVHAFFVWFAEHETLISEGIEAEKNPESDDARPFNYLAVTSLALNRLLPGFTCEFGPGPSGKGGYSFSVSGEGIASKQLIAEFWCSQAPVMDNWTFYPSRQPCTIDRLTDIHMHEQQFAHEDMRITPALNEETQKLDIMAWHPLFEGGEEDQSMNVLYIMLDEILGEYGTDQWIGSIELGDNSMPNAISVKDVWAIIQDLKIERKWTKPSPTEAWQSYSIEPSEHTFIRSDIRSGKTLDPMLVSEYISAGGQLDDPLEGTGAEFVFVAFESAILPTGKEADFRREIEDKLGGTLQAEDAGKHIGSAMGDQNCYIDLLITDGEHSLDLIMQALQDSQLPDGTGLYFFAKGNEGRLRFLGDD